MVLDNLLPDSAGRTGLASADDLGDRGRPLQFERHVIKLDGAPENISVRVYKVQDKCLRDIIGYGEQIPTDSCF